MLRRAFWAVLISLIVPWQPATAQVVSCNLTIGVYTYAASGWCSSDAIAEAGPRTRLADWWLPTDSVRVVLHHGPSDNPPWRGVLLFGSQPLVLEIDEEQLHAQQKRLVLRTILASVVVREWREVPPVSGTAGPPFSGTAGQISFVFGLVDYPRAGPDDVAILESASARLETLAVGDREDDRNCADPPGHASLFCVLAAAVESQMGRYHHRQPALELIREVIRNRWPERVVRTPVLDFDNHPDTTPYDLRMAIEEALALARTEMQGTM